jgi:hypothetical protein
MFLCFPIALTLPVHKIRTIARSESSALHQLVLCCELHKQAKEAATVDDAYLPLKQRKALATAKVGCCSILQMSFFVSLLKGVVLLFSRTTA